MKPCDHFFFICEFETLVGGHVDTGDQISTLVTTEIKEKILGSSMVKHSRAGRQRRIPLH